MSEYNQHQQSVEDSDFCIIIRPCSTDSEDQFSILARPPLDVDSKSSIPNWGIDAIAIYSYVNNENNIHLIRRWFAEQKYAEQYEEENVEMVKVDTR